MSELFKQKLLNDFIVVRMQEEVPGLIKLPDWQRVLRGEVIAVGPGKQLANGARTEMQARVGDTVTFAATAGMDSSYGVGTKVRLMRDTDVDAVLA